MLNHGDVESWRYCVIASNAGEQHKETKNKVG